MDNTSQSIKGEYRPVVVILNSSLVNGEIHQKLEANPWYRVRGKLMRILGLFIFLLSENENFPPEKKIIVFLSKNITCFGEISL